MIDAARFWKHVDVLTNDCDSCWIWTGAVRDDGYGRFFVGNKERRAHWVAWEIRLGSPPPREYKLIRKCVRADCVRHWELGGKRRKLSRVHLEEIRASRLGCSVLAKKYRVHRHSIWRHRVRTDATGYPNLGRV